MIPTHRRAHLISYTLEELTKQTYDNFEVLVILKPSDDETEDIIKKFMRALDITLTIQEKGYVTDALNMGIKNARGDIVAFLDDDAVPLPNWLESHVKTYGKLKVGGVAGDVIPAILKEKKVVPISDNQSEIIPNYNPFAEKIGYKIWNKPLEGMENYLVYISKAGSVAYNTNLSNVARYHITKSLLGMGANMSVPSEIIKDFRLSRSWILGLAYEQFLGWYIWKKGYNLIFNPNAKVYHISHGQTLTRNIKARKRNLLRIIENNLLFYRLCNLEKRLSWMHRITWLIYSNMINIKKLCKDKEIERVIGIKSTLYSEAIGLKWLISRKLGGKYSLLRDLERFID